MLWRAANEGVKLHIFIRISPRSHTQHKALFVPQETVVPQYYHITKADRLWFFFFLLFFFLNTGMSLRLSCGFQAAGPKWFSCLSLLSGWNIQANISMTDLRMPISWKKKKSSSLGSEILSQRGEAGKEGEVQETRRCEQAQSRAPGPAQAPRGARTSRAPGGGARPAARPRPLRPKPPPLPSHCAARARRCVRPRPPGDPAVAGPPWSTSARPRLVAWAEEGEKEGCWAWAHGAALRGAGPRAREELAAP